MQSGFSSVSKISSSKWVRQPPILPYRLQYSTFGRYGLHRRVRDGNGCYPIPYRHRKYLVVSQRSCRKLHRTPSVFLCSTLSFVVHSFLQVTLPSPQVTRHAPHLVPGRVPYTNLLPSQSLHASMQACSSKRLLQEL